MEPKETSRRVWTAHAGLAGLGLWCLILFTISACASPLVRDSGVGAQYSDTEINGIVRNWYGASAFDTAVERLGLTIATRHLSAGCWETRLILGLENTPVYVDERGPRGPFIVAALASREDPLTEDQLESRLAAWRAPTPTPTRTPTPQPTATPTPTPMPEPEGHAIRISSFKYVWVDGELRRATPTPSQAWDDLRQKLRDIRDAQPTPTPRPYSIRCLELAVRDERQL